MPVGYCCVARWRNKDRKKKAVILFLVLFVTVVWWMLSSSMTDGNYNASTVSPTILNRNKNSQKVQVSYAPIKENDTQVSLKGTQHNRRQDHFVYVKVEKTGSTTFSNIFSSYGYRHRLHLMMSTNPYSNLVDTRRLNFGESWDICPNRSNIHIMEQHARYRQDFYDYHFPNNTVYLASLREPVSWFVAFVDAMPIYRHFSPREVLRNKRLFYLKRPHSVTGMQTQVYNNFIQYLGFDVYKTGNLTAVRDYIQFIEKKFLLVMITEYFDESLVLLKRLMNWSMADIFYKRSNSAKRKSGTMLIEEEKSKLLNLEHNLADRMLYEHFNQSLWTKIEKERNFQKEVELFRRLNKKVEQFCFSEELQKDTNIKLVISTGFENDFTIGEENCLAVRIQEGKAPDLVKKLDGYCPFRKWKG